MSAEVRVGQVWADNDWRAEGRTIKVVSVDATHATCVTLTNDNKTQEWLDNPDAPKWYRPSDRRGKETRILLRRFKPTSTGYVLISGGPS